MIIRQDCSEAEQDCSRNYQGKRVNSSYRSFTQGNPFYVIFRHGSLFFRGYYRGCVDSRSDFPETIPATNCRGRHCMFRFCFITETFSALSAVFLFRRAFVWFVLVLLVIIWRFIWFQGFKQNLTATATTTLAV